MQNFWQELKKKNKGKPILCLAPMADVTDRAFRQIIVKYSEGKVSRTLLDTYVTWTEFVSADGLCLGGKEALINDLAFTKKEKPIVAQFFTSKPEMMEKATALAVKFGFDGIDINMGCPDKSVEKQNAGAKLIKNPKLARELIRAAQKGYKDAHCTGDKCGVMMPPISVKTRVGYSKNELETWLPELLAENPAAIIIHARIRKQLSFVPADWRQIKRAVEIRDKIQRNGYTLIIGNGDIKNLEDAKQKAKETGCDGVMIGRGLFGNPWFFSGHTPTTKEKLKVLVEHTGVFEKIVLPKPPKGQGKSFAVMKKHFKAYVNGFDGAKELRAKLMEAENAKEVADIVKNFLL